MAPFGKRKGKAAADSIAVVTEVELVEMSAASTWLKPLCSPFNSPSLACYDMDRPSDRLQLCRDIWRRPFQESLVALMEANPALVAVLREQLRNESKVTDTLVVSKERLLSGILLCIARAQSQKKMPLITAALSILSESVGTPRLYHNALAAYFKGAAASETWVEQFLVEARAHRPPPTQLTIRGVAIATFDNLSMNVDYKSYMTDTNSPHFCPNAV